MGLLQVDLKNPEYLEEYEACIRKLPLDDLYEILDIIKKDSSPERIQIVVARIHELDEGFLESKRFSEIVQKQPPGNKKVKIKKITPEEDPYRGFCLSPCKKISEEAPNKGFCQSPCEKISEVDQIEISRTVDELIEKYRNNPTPRLYLRMNSIGPYFSSEPENFGKFGWIGILLTAFFLCGLFFCMIKELLS